MARIEGCMSGILMKLSKPDVVVIGIGHLNENQTLELLFGPDSQIWFDGDRVATSHDFAGKSHAVPECLHAQYDSPTSATFTTGCRQ